jgi:hypothetical protein
MRGHWKKSSTILLLVISRLVLTHVPESLEGNQPSRVESLWYSIYTKKKRWWDRLSCTGLTLNTCGWYLAPDTSDYRILGIPTSPYTYREPLLSERKGHNWPCKP